MTKRMKVIEGIKSLLILLLICSAVFLASRTALRGPLTDLLSPELNTNTAGVYHLPTQRVEMARPVRMAAAIPGEGRILRYGVQYDPAACDALFQQGASLLVEALSSASQPREISREEWQRALTAAPNLYFDFLGRLPLALLANWLSAPDCTLTGTARQLVLTTEGEKVLLCYRDTEENKYYAWTAGVVNPEHLVQAVSTLSDNGAFFAFESEEYAAIDPDTLILQDTPQPGVYQSANPLNGEGDGLTQILNDLYFPQESTAFYSAGDEQVARNGGESIRLSRRGVLEYSCDSTGDSRYVITDRREICTLTEIGDYCRFLTQRALGQRCGQARLYLSAIGQEEDGSVNLSFDYCLEGARVSLEGGPAASFLVKDGRVVQFTLRCRRYTLSEQTALLLPERQAMAILEQLDGQGEELQLLYLDQGGEAVSAQWAAGSGIGG